MNSIRHFLLALQFFTRVPVTGRLAAWVGYSPQMLRASAAHLPGIGWLVGGVAALVFAGVAVGLSGVGGALAAAVLSTVATVMLTGAFHEDGLADVADGLGGSANRERALEIMKDSRIGAFGTVALVLALGLKFALLALLAGRGLAAVAIAIVGAHVLSRLMPLFLIRWLPYVGDSGASKAKPLADAISRGALAIAVVWTVPAVALLLCAHDAVHVVAAVLAAVLAAGWMARLFLRRLQGFTGDGLGATQQVCELAIYLALAWSA
ncbi:MULTISPECIES: adenosylcobinamide-GDP ribazoletransferase [unclassified Variovorax]|jgi:adenosylcobinamide-GDP ribazoletransferase|uniref:adenosylcobinamide-GDP ribazoletransferase n=1 Tax=unclassified Variovorax TaxID=663243 RepID=UPI000F7E9823|nr:MULTISPECIES: adenosylcobinamide-GDP ribazoletransferase [unclassified Variovorax]RSZ35244.1 adenosylcobinamide-GDP ribazoletransferase [Variovorax sp. 553]RSZ35740.1 adenosylcobinamide-GDP ribazoletransferase [Variovorax sp. 679]